MTVFAWLPNWQVECRFMYKLGNYFGDADLIYDVVAEKKRFMI
ncbi:hypothetical protein [Erwinia amylovora]|nr:hypothetical protein [Erwinia amylovora]